MAAETLWESQQRRAHEERERVRTGKTVIRRADLPVESTPLGRLRWYLHGDLLEPVSRALYFFELEIPVGSRSGKLLHQGGIVNLVVEGSGETEFQGTRHSWERGDVIALPVQPKGVVFQHFNTGEGRVRLVVAYPNLDTAIGPDGGVQMTVLEPAPEYETASTESGSRS